MPIQAKLCWLHLQSPQPEAMAAFYARADGVRPHEARTLNLWGKAIMRS